MKEINYIFIGCEANCNLNTGQNKGIAAITPMIT